MTGCAQIGRGLNKRAGALLTSVSVAVVLVAALSEPALAGIGLGIAPKYPTLVQVGQTGVPVSLSIQNTSSAPQNTGDVTLSNIRHTPSCGDASASVCVGTNIDPGVFSVSSTATGGGNAECINANTPFACCTGAGTGTCAACTGLTFTVAVVDVTPERSSSPLIWP